MKEVGNKKASKKMDLTDLYFSKRESEPYVGPPACVYVPPSLASFSSYSFVPIHPTKEPFLLSLFNLCKANKREIRRGVNLER